MELLKKKLCFMNSSVLLLLIIMILSPFQITPTVNCYSILGVFPTLAKSHYKLGYALMQGLSNDGHNVTMISPYHLDKPIPNFRNIFIEDLKNVWSFSDQFEKINCNHYTMANSLLELSLATTNHTLRSNFVNKLLRSKTAHFDVVIVEVFLNEAMLGFGPHFNAPIIGFSPFGASKATNDMVGSPSPLSYIPHVMLPYTDSMTFKQRFINSLVNIFEMIFFNFVYMPQQQKIYKNIFSNNNYSLEEIRTNVSLVLLNTHFALTYPRPYMTNMIEIGGFHLNNVEQKSTKAILPNDIERFINGAGPAGVIYFSMGSHLKGVSMSQEKQMILLNVFASLKQRVLWKLEKSNLLNKPENVMISKWFPQERILAHPNIKVFLTHGGLLSTMESIYHAVPIIGIPVYGDQSLNMAKAVRAGYGIEIKYHNLTENSLKWAIHEIISNNQYKINAKLTSERYRDHLKSPLETAIYWVEYIARHKGAPHLRSNAVNLPYFIYHNLDVLITMSVIILGFFYFILQIIRFVLKYSTKLKQKIL